MQMQMQNVPAVQTTLHQGSRVQSKQLLMIFETVKHGNDFTKGMMNVWGGECLGGERLTIPCTRAVSAVQVVVDDI